MAQDIVTLTLEVRVAWWFRWFYLPLLYLGALHGLEPRMERVDPWIRRAVSVRVHG